MEKKENLDIRERIKTFDDAVQATGMTLPFNEEQLAVLPKDVVAYMKLRIIAAALNGLTKDTLHEFPTFEKEELRYSPLFKPYTHSEIEEMTTEDKEIMLWGASAFIGSRAGLACSSSDYAWAIPWTNFAARLAVKSKEVAIYFGCQFKEIWKDYVVYQKN